MSPRSSNCWNLAETKSSIVSSFPFCKISTALLCEKCLPGSSACARRKSRLFIAVEFRAICFSIVESRSTATTRMNWRPASLSRSTEILPSLSAFRFTKTVVSAGKKSKLAKSWLPCWPRFLFLRRIRLIASSSSVPTSPNSLPAARNSRLLLVSRHAHGASKIEGRSNMLPG